MVRVSQEEEVGDDGKFCCNKMRFGIVMDYNACGMVLQAETLNVLRL